MNPALDQKKVSTFLFAFNYMQQPWRLQPGAISTPAPKRSQEQADAEEARATLSRHTAALKRPS